MTRPPPASGAIEMGIEQTPADGNEVLYYVANVPLGTQWSYVIGLSELAARLTEQPAFAALGPDAVWHANGDHPLPAFWTGRGAGGGWSPIIDATFDRVVAARGNGLDLVLARAEED